VIRTEMPAMPDRWSGGPHDDVAVRVRGVTKEFGTGGSLTKALRGVDLDVPYGEMLMLVGPSGCGKTTLVSIVAGTLAPTDGEVVVLGKDLMAMSNGRKVRFRLPVLQPPAGTHRRRECGRAAPHRRLATLGCR
jgi:ABC-type glutathione transport system ATPase component